MDETRMTFDEAFRLAAERYAEGRLDVAEQVARQLVQFAGERPDALHLLGAILLDLGRADEAGPLLEEAAALDPDSSRFAAGVGRVLELRGDLDGAVEHYRRAVDLAPDDASAHLLLGLALHRAGHYEDASDVLAHAGRLDPNDAQALQALALTLRALGLHDEAVSAFREALARAANEPEIHYHLARTLLELRRFDESIAAFRRALALDPDGAEIAFGLAEALEARDEADRAPSAPPAAEPTAPTAADTSESLLREARRAESRRDAKGAARAYRRLLALEPGRTEIYYALGSALDAAGLAAEAAEAYLRALEHDPNDIYAKWKLQLLNIRNVPRWHFPMLHDEQRNDAYERAIQKVVGPDSIVLEIGAGSGLLAMMAARAGARHVYTCEVVGLLADVARRVVAANGLADRVTVIHKKSTDLRVGVDLPRRADVLVSELLTAGLLGEGHFESVQHAIDQLIAPNAPIIPRSATVTGLLLESQELVDLEHLETVSGFDLREFNRLALPSFVPRRLSSHTHTPLSDRFPIRDFDLCDPNLADETWSFDVPITQNGTAQAIAYWFEMALDDESVITNSPDLERPAWIQAVQLLPPRRVEAGTTIEVVGRHNTVHMVFGWD